MKKTFLMMFIAIAMISCSPDSPEPPPVPVESTPTVTLTVSSENVPYGSNVNVSWTSTNAKTVTLNGEAVATSGSKDYSNMILTTKFSATATNVVKTTSVEKIVIVGDEPAPVVVITTTPNDAVLPYGNNVTVTCTISNAKTATLNGVAIGMNEIKVFSKVLLTTDFTIIATNVTKSTTVKKTVTVGDWTTSRFGLLTHVDQHWWFVKKEAFINGILATTYYADNTPGSPKYEIYFPNYLKQTYNENNHIIGTPGSTIWELIENDTKLKFTFSTGTHVYLIISLTQTEFIYKTTEDPIFSFIEYRKVQ